ncbi:efflux RND transporter periplasmic adaptor subunit [Ideonella azotifigens]|uniref:Efflux RND transporter periplasmic adaptor subunit n=1 Tax=Ideonella azotifigens TaxID=513160 RepID=A0ABN1JX32_9BURK|nr:efflux RND transporter periplasmic adaptor subunit [Ideonella azotifigens]MCD2341248.1 efflux RND transporter periplasmic adaptor subunit [Ideonella azotifigens]
MNFTCHLRRPGSRPALLIVAAASSVVVALAGCSPAAQAPAARPPVEVGVVTLKPEALALQTELPGRVRAANSAEVRPQVGGVLRARLFEEGSVVKAGQVLYRIEPATYQAAVDQAQAALVNAEASVGAARLKAERYAALVKINGIAQQDADDAQVSYQQALASVAEKKAALASARIDLAHTEVTAPISGRIGISSVTPGALLTASQTTALATIRGLDKVDVDLTQSSAELLKLRRLLAGATMKAGSTAVNLKLEDGSAYAQAGTLKLQEVAVDEATGSVTLRASFPNPEGLLLPGMYVRAVLAQAQDSAALLAPQQGVTRDPKGNATALVVNSANKVEQRTLTTDRAIGDRWLVGSGLAAGERLVVEGSDKVKAGDTVKPVAVELGAKPAATAEAAASAVKGG